MRVCICHMKLLKWWEVIPCWNVFQDFFKAITFPIRFCITTHAFSFLQEFDQLWEFKHLVNVYIMFEVYKISSGKGCNRRNWVHVDILYIAFTFHKKWGTYLKLPMIFFRNSNFCQLIDAHSTFLWHKILGCCVECFVPFGFF